jgi:16S rRNA (guanine966-N2)-methyltransferase
MRITGGAARGINLLTGKRDDVRPATDMLRQAVFSSLGADVAGARCLDLFAGTGAYGLESLSRGACGVRFVEMDRDGVKSIAVNIQAVCKSMKCGEELCAVEQRDVFKWGGGTEKFNLVFADPPYAMLPGRAAEIFALVAPILAEGGLFIFEMPAELTMTNPKFDLLKKLGKGRNDPSACIYSLIVEGKDALVSSDASGVE